MQLIYSNPEQTSIQVTLDEGEQLGNITGPGVIFVPNDPANVEYADLQQRKSVIEDYPKGA
jgi:hypothetical protein